MYKTLNGFLEKIKPGEAILVEYSSLDHPELLFYSITRWAKEKEFPILIHDILDTFHIFLTHLKLSGFDVSFLEKNVYVIKCGGSTPIGNIIRKARLYEDISIYSKEVREAQIEFIQQAKRKPVIVLVLGVEKTFNAYENQPMAVEYFFEVVIRKFLGNPQRIAFLFGNPHLVTPEIEAELKECMTKVIKVHGYGKKIRIEKSTWLDEIGTEVKV
ncbi:MAG: DUF257 family protein [Thermococcus sp.]|uniref:DUF257 family protein n=1 Tax=Thermococcus sp. TaxID=35749 RepID=UPI001D47C1F6|nr:DUF257 family protein [Thermococcus sp.]MBO8174749.1 DUF257 family protein [Thermococcus sp.]